MLTDLPGQPQGGWVISGQSQICTPAGAPAKATTVQNTDARGVVEEGDDTLIGQGNGKQAPQGCLGPRGAHPLIRAVRFSSWCIALALWLFYYVYDIKNKTYVM